MLNPYLKLGTRRRLYAGIAVLASILMMAVMWYHGAPLKDPGAAQSLTPRGIVDLELCRTANRANEILASWTLRTSFRDAEVRLLDVAIDDTWLDFGFIVVYSTAATLFCGYVANQTPYVWLSSLLIMLSWGQPVAGCLDVIENIGMLVMLHDGTVTGEFLPVVVTICARIKFALVSVVSPLGLCTIAFTALVKSSGTVDVGKY